MRAKDGNKSDVKPPFVLRSLEMYQSLAWQALDFVEKAILECLEIEHLSQGGAQNGRLIVTYNEFEKAGIRRSKIKRALDRLQALGFIEYSTFGYDEACGKRHANNYTLTYVNSRHETRKGAYHPAPRPSNAWRKLNSEAGVKRALARAEKKRAARRRTQLAVSEEVLNLEPAAAY
ncbi:MAG: hypothetical protein AAF968_06140 [Pseudomonadota bacterium]